MLAFNSDVARRYAEQGAMGDCSAVGNRTKNKQPAKIKFCGLFVLMQEKSCFNMANKAQPVFEREKSCLIRRTRHSLCSSGGFRK